MLTASHHHTSIEGFRNGDKALLQSIYSDLFPMLKRWILSNSGTSQDAEDIFHNTLVAVYRNCQRPDFSIECDLNIYLFAVGKKLWLQKLRRKKVENRYEASIPKDPHENNIENLIEESEILELYGEYFNQLGEECRKLLKFVFEGKSMKEIAELLNFNNEAHARKNKFRCKNKLIDMISKDPRYKELKKD